MASSDGEGTTGSEGRKPHRGSILSPRFRSAAALAGWDEEMLLACLVVEDTPDRECKCRKRTTSLTLKSPQATTGRKRRANRRTPTGPVTVFNLEDDRSVESREREETQTTKNSNVEEKKEDEGVVLELVEAGDTQKIKISGIDGQDKKKDDCLVSETSHVAGQTLGQACLDRLREELSCAICLDICFEPSTTPCGHSFCKRCLRSAADKCGRKCPKCREMISIGRACTINTVLWNTIQLLFPQEVEAKKGLAVHSAENKHRNKSEKDNYCARGLSTTQSTYRSSSISSRRSSSSSSRRRVSSQSVDPARRVPNQSEDAALAFRLQREEFMESLRSSEYVLRRGNSLCSARANLRAMATRAINLRSRSRPT